MNLIDEETPGVVIIHWHWNSLWRFECLQERWGCLWSFHSHASRVSMRFHYSLSSVLWYTRAWIYGVISYQLCSDIDIRSDGNSHTASAYGRWRGTSAQELSPSVVSSNTEVPIHCPNTKSNTKVAYHGFTPTRSSHGVCCCLIRQCSEATIRWIMAERL